MHQQVSFQLMKHRLFLLFCRFLLHHQHNNSMPYDHDNSAILVGDHRLYVWTYKEDGAIGNVIGTRIRSSYTNEIRLARYSFITRNEI